MKKFKLFSLRSTRLGVAAALVMGALSVFASPAFASSTFTWGTASVSPLTFNAATVSYNTTDTYSYKVDTFRFCYSTVSNPSSCASTPGTTGNVTTVAYNGTTTSIAASGGTGTISEALTGLSSSTKYYYMFSGVEEKSPASTKTTTGNFTTPAGPTLNLLAATVNGATSATLSASVNTVNVASNITFCYSTSSTLANCAVTSGSVLTQSAGTYTTSALTTVNTTVTGLSPSTKYYFDVEDTTNTAYSATVNNFTTDRRKASVAASDMQLG